ncbi:uncharacterized protein LOC129914228 [Episyrphus balteatus]|uniref:uncharacterized protein LOC129914228 n=1 Tax=Episyrphus balteatus TaxID=286459 RepID=UPI00248692C8|nr:uncharacterized protein LOC129914228 [Episyrphus balteatus]
MSSKKINLKNSVNAINAKSTAAGKKKALPKLKVILANPYKPKFEQLIDNELSQFKELISSEIKSSGTTGRLFVKQNNIQLGLGSSLRTIGNKKASCVIISHSIKPKFIIDQIGSFTRQSNKTVPVFIVEDWENICAKLFDVKALVSVFPLNVSGELGKWISNRTLTIPKVDQKLNKVTEPIAESLPPDATEKRFNLESMYLTKPLNGKRSFIPDVVVKSEPIPTNQEKDWTGDFISFSNTKDENVEKMDMDEIDEEFNRKQDKALEALKRIANKIQKVDNEPKAITKSKEEKLKFSLQKKIDSKEDEEWENDKYVSLQVHKIQPNPNRKPKNKRKKKNKNKTNKVN